MSADVFLDTNIFIYQLDSNEPLKQRIAERVIREASDSGRGCISFQVIQEYLNVSLRKAAIPLQGPALRRYLDNVLAPLLHVHASVDLYHRALDIQGRYGYHFYDSLIVAAALLAGCRTLYSEDLQHGQRIETLVINNPFAEIARN